MSETPTIPAPDVNTPAPDVNTPAPDNTAQMLLNKEVLGQLPRKLRDDTFLSVFTDGLKLDDLGSLSADALATLADRADKRGYLLVDAEPAAPVVDPDTAPEPPQADPLAEKMRDLAVMAQLPRKLRDAELIGKMSEGIQLEADGSLGAEALATINERAAKWDYLLEPVAPGGSHPRTPGHRAQDIAKYDDAELAAFADAGTKPGAYKERPLAGNWSTHMQHMKVYN